ncbi:MAG TPA: LppP/LprE family lipoprotein [Solirubrobacteraceae bacterium]|nr:LppP/LprE family lipoprotein [Solirubrobacteraceae bacterium]
MSAARVRLPPRRKGVRLWGMRLMGVTATSALLAILAWVLLSIYAERNGGETVVSAAPAATPAPVAKKEKAAPRKAAPKLTPSQRRDRAAAVVTLGGLGYRPVTLKTYEPAHVLHVLIGKGEGGRRAFFFAGAKYLGNDAADDSAAVEVVRAGNRSVSLSYRLFAEGDRPCCPTGSKVRVLFRWDGKKLAPQTAIPPAAQRRAPAA